MILHTAHPPHQATHAIPLHLLYSQVREQVRPAGLLSAQMLASGVDLQQLDRLIYQLCSNLLLASQESDYDALAELVHERERLCMRWLEIAWQEYPHAAHVFEDIIARTIRSTKRTLRSL